MSIPTITLGILCIVYSIFSAIMRKKKPEMFKKLEPMKQQYGERNGNALHFTFYVVVPFVVGCSAISAGIQGISFF